MSVLKTQAHVRLTSLAERLGALKGAVPEEAEAFHVRCRELLVEVQELLSSWLPRLGDGRLKALEERVLKAEKLAEILRDQLSTSAALTEEVTELRGRVSACVDEQDRHFLEQRCQDYEQRLKRIAVTTRPGDPTDPDHETLKEIEEGIRRDFQATFWLGRLEKALDSVEDGLEDLMPGIAELRETFLGEGASSEWLREIRRRVEEVEMRVEIEAKRPQELVTVARLLPRLRGWSRDLGSSEGRVRKLEMRYRDVVMEDWRTPLPAELKSEALQLEQTLLQGAAEIRQRHLEEFRARLQELVRLCGAQPDLQRRLDALESREIHRPQTHQGWLKEYGRLRERVGAIANTHRAELDRRLAGRLDEIHEALSHLRADPISDKVAESARRAEQAAEKLSKTADATSALVNLTRSHELLAEISELRRQALAEVQALHTEQARLRQQNAALRAEGERIGLAIPDLGPRIDELTLATEGSCSLELSKQTAGNLARELEAAQRQFVDRCRERLAETIDSMQQFVEVLVEIDPQRVRIPPPRLDDTGSAEEATAALLAADKILASIQSEFTAAGETLRERRRQTIESLAARAAEALDPVARDNAEHLAAELAGGAFDRAPESPQDLLRLALLLEKADGFEEQLDAERQAVIARRASLVQRVQELREQQLEAVFPRLAKRLSALTYGLPNPPLPSAEIQYQLKVTEELCDRLERHVRRWAAHQVADGVRLLAQDGGEEEHAELLAEIEPYRLTGLPPARLRRRLQRAVRRRKET